MSNVNSFEPLESFFRDFNEGLVVPLQQG